MGRHAAPVEFDGPARTRDFGGAHPVTDPVLLDAVAAATANAPQRAVSPSRPARSAVPLTEPYRPRAANPVVTEHQSARHPRPVAPRTALQPIAASPRTAVLAFSDGPVTITPRFVAATLRTAPIPSLLPTRPITTAPTTTAFATPPEELPRTIGRRRAAALTACAIAVLGAASTAAAILPSTHASADSGNRCVAFTAQPKPSVKLTRHGPMFRGLTPRQRTTSATADPPASGRATAASSQSASASPTGSSSASASSSAAASASATPTDAATPGSSSSTSPSSNPQPSPSSNPVTTVVGSLLSVLSGLASGQGVSLAEGVFTFNDFSSSNMGVTLPGGLSGAGESQTILRMNAYTSTRAGVVPTASGSTNPLSLMLVQSGSPTLQDFTLQGTPQGHLYNGLRIKGTTGAHITNVRVNSIPGDDKVNPGETFGINDFHTTNSVYTGVEIDGGGVGASALGFNSSANPTVTDSYFHDNPYSAGIALWQTHDATLTDVVSTNNRTGINLERVSGTVNIVRPTLENNSAQDLYVGSDQSSVKITIVDPTFSGKIRIRIPANYWAGPEQQQRSDIHVIIGGVDRTSSVVQWV